MLYQNDQIIAGTTNSASKISYTNPDNSTTTVQDAINKTNKSASSTLSISATDETDFIRKLIAYVKSTYGTNYGIKHLAGDWQGYVYAIADVSYGGNLIYGQVYFPQITKNAYRFFTDNGGASIESAPFKDIEFVGSYAGNQTINISQYLKSGDTADNFIVEYLGVSASNNSTSGDSRGTSYWGNNVSIGARTISKAISGTNLVISNAQVGAGANSFTREWTGVDVGCTSNISYRVWYKG